MKVVHTVNELRELLRPARFGQLTVGLVPTMGYLHEGHLALMRAAVAECDVVVVSLFVNPTQFRPDEDLDSYPTDFERDRRLAQRCGVHLLFAPDRAEIYGDGFCTKVAVSGLTEVLCGAANRRGPEHFHGVTTVVAKLFNIVQPDIAYFGQKDAQQARVIGQMVSDLNFPVKLRVLPTVRDDDGLALSSRNTYLSTDERLKASSLSRALGLAERLVLEGERDRRCVLTAALAELLNAGVEPEYLEAVSARTLEPIDPLTGEVLIAVAAQVGKARLIDNIKVTVPRAGSPVTDMPNGKQTKGTAALMRR